MAGGLAPGGLTFSPAFVSKINSGFILNPEQSFIVAEDGKKYHILNSEGTSTNLQLVDYETGLITLTLTNANFDADATALGWDGVATAVTSASNLIIPGTPYFLRLDGRSAAVSTERIVLYYKAVNGTTVTPVGLVTQNNLDSISQSQLGLSVKGVGFVRGTAITGAVNEVKTQYPIALAYILEAHASIMVLPSINQITNAVHIQMSDTADPWFDAEIKLDGTLIALDNNSLRVNAQLNNEATRSMAFFLPVSAGSLYLEMFYLPDISEHVAGTANPVSTYLTAHAADFSTGLISSLQVDGDVFDPSGAGLLDVDAHIAFEGFPWANTTTNFDDTPGLATENWFGQPSAYPATPTDIAGPWLLFFPRHYRKAEDRGKFGVKVMEWNPSTGTAFELDFAKGVAWTPGVELSTFEFQQAASIFWNQATNELFAAIKVSGSGFNPTAFFSLGTFSPVFVCKPSLNSLMPDITLFVDEEYEKDYSLFFNAVAGADMTFSAVGLPTGLVINAVTGVVSGAITDAVAEGSTHNVTITATRVSCGSAQDTFVITVGTTIASGGPSFTTLHSAS